MSEFRRFVAYINLYEGNSKICNVGFAKIERRGEQCRIEIHMKETGYHGISCPMYFFIRQEEKMLGISIGELSFVNGNADKRILLDGNSVGGSGYDLEQISGFIIFANEKNMFASQWDEKELQREQFIRIEDSKEKDNREISVEKVCEKNEESETTLKAAEAVTISHSEPTREERWEEKWRFILENYPVLTPFQEEEEILCVRIELKDLRLLPKHFWYLGNNSFLLHGFFNYRYLIVGQMQEEDTRRWFLGVPGVFQSQEKVMASIFGFPEYKGEKIAKQKTGQFGYWYRYLDL